mgnify:CR=1 FL=1
MPSILFGYALMLNMNHEDLLKLETIEDLSPSDQVHTIGSLFDFSYDHNNIQGVEHGFKLSEQIDREKLSDEDYTVLHYDLANGWSYLRKLKYRFTKSDWDFQMDELMHEIFYLRKAVASPGFHIVQKERQCQIYTNLGSSFSYIGRFVEAQDYWNKALAIIPHFPMALGNKGNGLYYYGRMLFDEIHANIFIIYAYHFLESGLSLRQYLEGDAEQGFQSLKDHIENNVPKDFLQLPDLNTYELGDDVQLKQYRQWCLDNKLYINPLNDLGAYTVACHDCLNLPTMIIPAKRPPVCLNLFNQIKQEYATARYSLYQSNMGYSQHISDIDVPLMDSMETVRYSYYIEQLKIAFRLSYSILDKIAYLLNDYLELQIPERQVSFKSLWYSDHKKKALGSFFISSDNWALRGLFWLSKDLYEKSNDFDSVLEPEAKEIAEIRNFIEHKGLKVLADVSFWQPDYETDISYTITRNDLEKKTINLLKLARAAIIYTAIAISHEENKKDYSDVRTIPIGGNTIPPFMRV